MKIALVTPTWKKIVGGVDIFNRDLSRVIEKRGHDLDVFTLELFNDTQNDIKGNEKRLGEYFNKVNEKEKYDVVICNGEYGYGVNHPRAINVFHGNNYDYAFNLRDFDSEEKTKERLDRIPIQKEAARNKYVVAVSNFAISGLNKSGIDVDQVINLSADTSNFKPLNSGNKGYNLAVSRGDYYGKGLDILEKWSRDIKEKTIFLGDYKEKLENIVQPGHIDHEKLNKYYNEGNIFFNPSRFEGGGLTTLESMACGCPPMVLPTGYGADIKEEIPEFVVENYKNQEEFLDKYNKINPKREKYSKKAIDYFWTFHDPKIFEKSWISLIEGIY